MTRFIKSVAQLTDRTSRDDLEVTLASVMFDLVGPEELRLWRLVALEDRPGDLRLRLRAQLRAGSPIAVGDETSEFDALPRLSQYPRIANALATLRHEAYPPDASGLYHQLAAIRTDRATVGVLELWTAKPIGHYQIRLIDGLMKIYGNHLRLLDASEYDELTGLANRRSFNDLQARLGAMNPASFMAAQADRRSQPDPSQLVTCIAVADIDYFKRINDRFGHLYGDEVLVLLARLMRRCFRESDRLFRFGGEEFVVMLTGSDRPGISAALERFRRNVEEFRFPQVGSVTISIGYTETRSGDTSFDTFGRADRALYEAKRTGRNRVVCYEDLEADGLVPVQTASRIGEKQVEFF